MADKKISTYPYRAPKKYPQKDLHGRMRFVKMSYKDFERFQRFYVNVFGWDMFELPVGSGGKPAGSENPSLLVATGPSYETWEGVVPGHMNVMAHHAEGELPPPMLFGEIHMDRPISESLEQMFVYGGCRNGDLAGEGDNWVTSVQVKDPSGNVIELWKCPSSRTWEEPEAGYDTEE